MTQTPTTTFEEEFILVQDCSFDPPHRHEFDGDWIFGGPDGTDPRTDARFLPSVFVYLDSSLRPVHTTSAFVCDDEAIDRFTQVAGWGLAPVYLQVRRPDEREFVMVPWTYDEATDEVTPFK